MTDSPDTESPGPLGQFDRHHDDISVLRQRNIASFVLLSDGVLIVLSWYAIKSEQWQLDFSALMLKVILILAALAFVTIVAASGLYLIAVAVVRSFSTWGPPEIDPVEPELLARARKYIFYPGMYLNLSIVCILIEQTGGVVLSPYTPVLFVMVLTGQQLGRFRMNSKIFVGFGIFVTLALFLIEREFGIRKVPPAPRTFEFAVLAASFLTTALITHSDKLKNYRGAGLGFPRPAAIELYLDADRIWRYSFHGRAFHLDPVLELDPALKDARHDVALAAAKASAESLLARVTSPGLADGGFVIWEDSMRGGAAVGFIKYPRQKR